MLVLITCLFETKAKVGLRHVMYSERISGIENLFSLGCCLDARTEWTVDSFTILIEEVAGLCSLVYPEFELLFRSYIRCVFG